MTRYVAFLGSINVGGHRVTMERLRAECEALGLRNVSTFIASGNVIFDSTARPASLERDLATHLGEQLGFDVPAFVRSAAAIVTVAGREPFDHVAAIDTHHVGFLRTAPSPAAITATESLSNDQDALAVVGTELHWRIHGKTMESSIKATTLAKAIEQPLTLRNITSVRKLAAVLSLAAG
jgi:uncharacterized protein (DUF1697 family)